MTNINDLELIGGKLPKFTSLGSYPLLYLTQKDHVLCADCATADLNGEDYFDDDRAATAFVHWEGAPETCENCQNETASAYGDPEENTND